MNAARGLVRLPSRPLDSGIGFLAGVTLLATLTVGTGSLRATEVVEVRGLLDRMVRASRSLDYIGTFVYSNGETMQSMKIIHRAEDEGSRERLVALSGAAREIIRDGQYVTCILPDDEIVVVARRRTGGLQPSPVFEPEIAIGDEIVEFYSFAPDGFDRVADRKANVIDVMPKDQYRYGYRLAVDHETGLLLKSELLDNEMTVLEQIVYTHLDLPESIPDEALEPRISHVGFTRYGAAAGAREESGSTDRMQEWTIGWLPPGFEMSDASYGPIQRGRDSVHHRVYSDGLVSLSIFIEPGSEAADRLEGLSSVGAINAFGRVVDEHQVSVVGEVPGITVKKVAAAIVKQ